MFESVERASALTESRLRSLYDSEGFGGEKTMRAKVTRELIDEIRMLRRDRDERARDDPTGGWRAATDEG
jgi:hypothetical protein